MADAAKTTGVPRSPEGGEEGGRGDGRVSRAQRLRRERRQQVHNVARRLFADKGYHETSIQDILDGAAIARGTFYLYFDSKRAIFDELVDDFLLRIKGVVRPVDISAAASPLQQIEENVQRVIALLHESRDLTSIILRLAEGLDRDCDEKMDQFYGVLTALLGQAIANGQHMGLLRRCDPMVVAQAALGGLKEVVLQWIVHRDSSQRELEHICREMLNYSLQGIYLSEGSAQAAGAQEAVVPVPKSS